MMINGQLKTLHAPAIDSLPGGLKSAKTPKPLCGQAVTDNVWIAHHKVDISCNKCLRIMDRHQAP